MGKRRHQAPRRRRASSADIRFTLVLLVTGAILLALGSVFAGQVREADWIGASISGSVALLLLAIALYSVVQRRRG
jgi:hypothetical protein